MALTSTWFFTVTLNILQSLVKGPEDGDDDDQPAGQWSVCWSVQHSGPEQDIFTTTSQVTVTFGVGLYGSQQMILKDIIAI